MADLIPSCGASLHDRVAVRLRAMVFDRELGPGVWIDEQALAQTWAASRVQVKARVKRNLPSATVKQGQRHAQ